MSGMAKQARREKSARNNRRAEINEALVPVLGFSQALLRNPEVGDPIRGEFLVRITDGARRLAQLINQSTPNERNLSDGNHTPH